MNLPQTPKHMNTAAGNTYDPMKPAPHALTSENIAHALAHIMRWGGHFIRFRSVAEHSLEVLEFALEACPNLSYEGQLYALLHDAGEAALGSDIPAPIKKCFPIYKRLEFSWLDKILKQYGVIYKNLSSDELRIIKEADLKSTELERSIMYNPTKCRIPLYSPDEAKKKFKTKLGVLVQRVKVMSH